ncbi:Putative acetyltransferase SA2342 [Serratia marcescens]|uniref:sugar O-acetyltransferase n=1 Tax=Serratia TaxID=613 RepID=UPI000744F0C3|nr:MULTISPECIES: sugar O-acetyltransferase [Serratia]MBH2684278.1 sugar O-acetyltransferase [Serratia marcescens]MBH3191839.1 sugar O-acetyltransferase [Serratia marcescens]MBN5255872.1 sugar O-acetyltransferase [Serratia marcescens]NMQ40136.1 sugar O-acetyltransferase [Serratia marcescens]CAI1749400.1 Putative acetyltransferase SA2342 [Serratia marcescens]
MTEREKLLSGLEYNSRDEELIAMYHRARALTKSLGTLDSHQADEKNRLLGELFGAWGEASWIETPFWCDYGQHVRIGKNCFINVNAVFLDCNTITIGDNTLIGPNVQIYTPSHPLKAGKRFTGDPAFPFRTSAQPVSIGSNVWIGGNVVILPGVTIGDGTTIGAGSIVTGDIPANVLALGQPCRVIRTLE